MERATALLVEIVGGEPGPLIEASDLPQNLQQNRGGEEDAIRAGMTIKEMERILIEKTLEATDGNRTHAAQMLGVTRKTLQNKIKEYGLA